MERRELLGLMGASAAGLLATGVARAGTQQDDKAKHDDPKHKEHLKTMAACIEACNEAAHHTLEYLGSGKAEHSAHAAQIHSLTMDCQAVCALTGTMMARHSSVVKPMHQACAEVCANCATECEKVPNEVVKKCAEACRACEKMCRECCAALA
jgi:hypothetical protein